MTPFRIHKTKEKDDDVIHQGSNVKRVREALGWKQIILANELGAGWSQKKISKLESSENVGEDDIRRISIIMDVPEALFRNTTRGMLKSLFRTAFYGGGAKKPELSLIMQIIHGINILIACQPQLQRLYDLSIHAASTSENINNALYEKIEIPPICPIGEVEGKGVQV